MEGVVFSRKWGYDDAFQVSIHWLGGLVRYLAGRGDRFAGAACAVGYDCLIRLGRTEAAYAWLETNRPVVARGGTLGLQELFGVLEMMGYYQKAAEVLLADADGSLQPDKVPVLVANNMAWALYRSGRSEEGLPWALAAVRGEPRNSAYLDTLGQILLATGDFAGAEENLRLSARITPRVGTLLGLAKALAALERFKDAAAAAQQTLSQNSGPWPPDQPSREEVRQWIETWKASS